MHKELLPGIYQNQIQQLEEKLDAANSKIDELTHENEILIVTQSRYGNSEQEYKKLLELTSEAVLKLNDTFTIIDCNEACLKMFGYISKHELLGKTPMDITAEYDIKQTKKKLDTFSDTKYIRIEKHFITKNGREFPAILSAYRFADYSIATIQDLSILKDYESAQKGQVELFTRQSIIRQKLSNVSTLNSFLEVMCHEGLHLTKAKCVWVLLVKDCLPQQSFSIKRNENKLVSLVIDQKDEIIKLFKTDRHKKIHITGRRNLIFPQLFIEDTIVRQQVLVTHLITGESFAIGLNYDLENENVNKDHEFLQYLSSFLHPIFDNIVAKEAIKENEAKFRALTEKLTDVILIRNPEGKYTYVSPSISKYGYEPESIIGKSAIDLVTAKDLYKINDAALKLFKEPNIIQIIDKVQIVCPDQITRYAEITLTNLINHPAIKGIVINARDITARIEYEDKLQKSELKFRSIFNHSNDGIFITSLDGKFLEVNDTVIKRIGLNKETLLNYNLYNLKKESSSNNVATYLKEAKCNGTATTELVYENQNGSIIHTEISGRLIEYNEAQAILHISRDIGARKELHRQILNAIIQTEEKERLRFAQDLHDGIGPYLSATKFFLSTIEREENPELRKRITDKALESIDEIIKNIKDISNNISPHVLQNFGIISALHSFRKKMPHHSASISISSNIEGIRFQDNLEIAIFRIITEMINNSLKYSEATEITISLLQKTRKLTVEYSDNGKGMDEQEYINKKQGNGLFNIINRVTSLKGMYKFTGEKGKGFGFRAIFIVGNTTDK